MIDFQLQHLYLDTNVLTGLYLDICSRHHICIGDLAHL